MLLLGLHASIQHYDPFLHAVHRESDIHRNSLAKRNKKERRDRRFSTAVVSGHGNRTTGLALVFLNLFLVWEIVLSGALHDIPIHPVIHLA